MAPTPPASQSQINVLLEHLSGNPQLARGLLRSPEGRLQAKKQWTAIAKILNGMGGCVKTVEQWQRVWADKKFVAKKNARARRRDANATGGGPLVVSNPTEEKILSILGQGFGLPQTSVQVTKTELPAEDPLFVPSPDAESPPASETGPSPVPTPPSSPVPTPPSAAAGRRRRVRPIPGVSVRSRLMQIEDERNIELRLIRSELSGIRNAIMDLAEILRYRK